MRSWRIHEDFWMDYCRRIFGPLDDVDVSKNEAQYKGVNIEAEHIVFVNASEDPWHYAGMQTLTKK